MEEQRNFNIVTHMGFVDYEMAFYLVDECMIEEEATVAYDKSNTKCILHHK